MGGSQKISRSRGCFSMICHLLIKIFLRFCTNGLYFLTKGNMTFCTFCFSHSAYFLSKNLTSARIFSTTLFGKPLLRNRTLKLLMLSAKSTFEELVLRTLRASSLMKPFATPGAWQEEKYVYWKVSVGLKCVRMSRIDSS